MALKLKGSTSGFVALDSPSVAGNNTLILPENNGSAHQILANDITAGVTTFTQITVSRNGDLTVPGTISIGGTLTYEDVTSVDSVGIVTARGLSIFGNTTGLNVASGISTFQAITGTTGTFSGAVSGTTGTFTGNVDIAANIRHIDDSDTYISFPANNEIEMYVASQQAIKFTTTSIETGDNKRIDIIDAAGDRSGEIKNSDSGANSLMISADPDNSGSSTVMQFSVDGSERLRITSGGNVEIGSGAGTGADFSLLDGMVINTANGSAGLLINSSSSSHNAYLGFSYGSGSSTSHADQYSAYIGRVGDNTLVLGTDNGPRVQVTSSGHLAPYTNDTYDLGTSSLKWSNVHIDNYVYVGTNQSGFKDNQLFFKSTGTAYVDHYTTGQSVQFRTSVSSSLDTNAFLLTSAGNATFSGTVTDSRGNVRSFPIVNYSSNVVVTTSHTGKTLPNTSGGWTFNTSTNWSPGQVMRVVNKSGSSQTVFQASGVTIYSRRDGGTSGDHSIVARGSAIVICTATNEYYISGDI